MPEPAGMRHGVRLGVDVGSVRVGLARCDTGGVLATPLTTIQRRGRDTGVQRIAELVRAEGVIEVIVGLPRQLSGSEGAAALAARRYAGEVAAAIDPVPVRLVDERLTTVSAHAQLRAAGRPGRRHRPVVDQAAATLILQAALDAERSGSGPAGEVVPVHEQIATKGERA